MEKKALDYFGEILMKRVRDASINHWDKISSGKMNDEENQFINSLGVNEKELFHRLIPKVVDTTLHYLLWTFEQEGNVDISVVTNKGSVNTLSQESDGLAGELYGRNGWIKKYSHQRDYNE